MDACFLSHCWQARPSWMYCSTSHNMFRFLRSSSLVRFTRSYTLAPGGRWGEVGGRVGGGVRVGRNIGDMQINIPAESDSTIIPGWLQSSQLSSSFPFACHSSIEQQNHCDPHMKVPRTCFAELPLLDVTTKSQSRKKKKKASAFHTKWA